MTDEQKPTLPRVPFDEGAFVYNRLNPLAPPKIVVFDTNDEAIKLHDGTEERWVLYTTTPPSLFEILGFKLRKFLERQGSVERTNLVIGFLFGGVIGIFAHTIFLEMTTKAT